MTPAASPHSRADVGYESRRFTVKELAERTPERTAHERLRILHCLPEDLRAQATSDLRRRHDHVADLDFRDWCRDGA